MCDLTFRIVSAIVACVLALAPSFVSAQDKPASNSAIVELDALGVPKEAEPIFTEAQATAWRDDVVDDVEAFTGKKFESVPAIRLVSRDQLVESWERDLREQMSRVAIGEQAELAVTLALLDKAVQSAFYFARYSHADKTLYIPAGNTAPLLTIMGFEKREAPDVMKLVIAHELAHALHDQHVDVVARYAARTEDERKALDATMEGFAMLVQNGVADRLNLNTLNQKLVKASTLDTAAMQSAVGFGRRFNEIYIAGLRFFQHHYAQHDMAHVWSVLENPPRTYAFITTPERYGEALATDINPDLLFVGIDTNLGAEGQRPMTIKIDSQALERTFGILGPAETKTIVDAVERAYTCLFRKSMEVRAVTAYELKNSALSEDLMASINAQIDTILKNIQARFRQNNVSMQEQTREIAEGEAVGFERVINLHERESPIASSTMTFGAMRSGPFVVQVAMSGKDIPADGTKEAALAVLKRLASGEAEVPVAAADTTNPLIAALQRVQPMLADAAWEASFQPQTKGAIENLIGENIEAQLALELGFQSAQSVRLEATSDPRDTRRMLLVSLKQFSSEETAQAVAKGLIARLPNAFGFFSRAGAEFEPGEVKTLELKTGGSLSRAELDVTMMGQKAHVACAVAPHGRHVMMLIDINRALGEVTADALVEALMRDLE